MQRKVERSPAYLRARSYLAICGLLLLIISLLLLVTPRWKALDDYRWYLLVCLPTGFLLAIAREAIRLRYRWVARAGFYSTGFSFLIWGVLLIVATGTAVEQHSSVDLLVLALVLSIAIFHFFALDELDHLSDDLQDQANDQQHGFPVVFSPTRKPDLTPHDRSQR